MLVLTCDYNRKNNAVQADSGCSGVPGFPYSREIQGLCFYAWFENYGALCIYVNSYIICIFHTNEDF